MRTSLLDAGITEITARLLRASLALIICACVAFALFVGWRIVGFMLSPPASWETPEVTGLVEAFNEPHAPMANIKVVLVDPRGKKHTTVTDQSGRFHFPATHSQSWPPRAYDSLHVSTLTIRHEGFTLAERELGLSYGEIGGELPPTLAFVRVHLATESSDEASEVEVYSVDWQIRKNYPNGGYLLPEWAQPLDEYRRG